MNGRNEETANDRTGGDPWLSRLSEYLDGDMAPLARRELERHLAGCVECTSALDELRQVVACAQGVVLESEPDRDLWPGISARLAPRSRARSTTLLRFGSRTPLRRLAPWLAAAAVLVLASAVTVVWVERTHRSPAPSPGPNVATAPAVDPAYDAAVADLQRQVRDRLTLDPHVVEAIDRNLATLDVAIADYRAALSEHPGDPHLTRRLVAARHRKLEVLRQAAVLAAEGDN